jgi:hypothetical protein
MDIFCEENLRFVQQFILLFNKKYVILVKITYCFKFSELVDLS